MNATGIAAIIAALFGGGGIVAFFKVRAESGSIVVSAAEKVLAMQEKALRQRDETIRRLEKALRQERQERQVAEKQFQLRIRALELELADCVHLKGTR